MISGCRMIGDSIGVVTADSSQPIIRGCYIYNCRVYGIDIRDRSEPDLGVSSAGYPGHDTIQECGDYNYHYLINNGSPQMIYAIGNVWQRSYTPDNDDLIYDDEESGGTSGNVILVDP
jgi:parallel beta-helix repeat protein